MSRFNTILLCCCFFFVMIESNFLILAVIAKTVSPTVEVVIPTGVQINEPSAEIKTKQATFESRISKCSI